MFQQTEKKRLPTLGAPLTAFQTGRPWSSRGRGRATHHPRFAAEVVDGVKRVDTGDPAEVEADHKVPEVLAGDHAVGVLTDEDKVRLEGPAGRRRRKLNPGYIAPRGRWKMEDGRWEMELKRSALRAR